MCGSLLAPTDLADWCLRCPSCGTWASTLPVRINGDAHAALDEAARATALEQLRHQNNRRILRRLRAAGAGPGWRLLDVGSAHGWFVDDATEAGFSAEGVEPDETVARLAAANGSRVRVGLFPEVVADSETFDVIAFNDVLEHLPDVRAAVAASRSHLRPGGLLSINIPNSQGLVFRAAVAAGPVRGAGLFARLWQVGLPSPHLWFFDREGLTRLCEQHNFELVASDSLASATRSGLWQRAHFDRRASPVTVAGVALAGLASPVLNSRRGSDIMHLLLRAA